MGFRAKASAYCVKQSRGREKFPPEKKNVRLGIKLNGKNIHLTLRSLSTKVEIVAGGVILGTER